MLPAILIPGISDNHTRERVRFLGLFSKGNANLDLVAASEVKLREFLADLSPLSTIRNRRLRLTADSPGLLTIIKQEGKV